AQHPHRNGHDVLRLREPHQGIFEIANESVWGVAGVEARRFRPGEPLMQECRLDSFSGPLDVEHWTPQQDFSAPKRQRNAVAVHETAENARARVIRKTEGIKAGLASHQAPTARCRRAVRWNPSHSSVAKDASNSPEVSKNRSLALSKVRTAPARG